MFRFDFNGGGLICLLLGAAIYLLSERSLSFNNVELASVSSEKYKLGPFLLVEVHHVDTFEPVSKCTSWYMRQIRLRIRTVWSEFSTDTLYVAMGFKHFFVRKTKTQIRQCGYPD